MEEVQRIIFKRACMKNLSMLWWSNYNSYIVHMQVFRFLLLALKIKIAISHSVTSTNLLSANVTK